MTSPKTLIEAVRFYTDLDHCQTVMVATRWPKGVVCPTCGARDPRYISTRRLWECKTKHPRKQFSVKVGTIFEDSPLGLDKWLPAVWMIANCKNGISSHELGRALGVTQKTAWFMLHRIRLAMRTGSFDKQMKGRVEADETFIGGAARFMHKDRKDTLRIGKTGRGAIDSKTAVMGLLERHGPDKISTVRAFVVPGHRRTDVDPLVRQNVKPGAEVITDALRSYDRLQDEYTHKVIDHAEEYVRGHVHTNGIENFWSLLKRALKGTYVAVMPYHLFRYVDEEVFRFNQRREPEGDGGRFLRVLRSVTDRRIDYKTLTGHLATA